MHYSGNSFATESNYMTKITRTEDVDWENIERGVPITNDSYFVRHDKDTGLIYDDRGGYIHQNNCFVENRREITWIPHNQSSTCPIAPMDIVLVETFNREFCLTNAYLVIWNNVWRYRVIRQNICTNQSQVSSTEIQRVSNKLKKNRKLYKTLVILAGTLII